MIAQHARNVVRWRKKKRDPDRLASNGAASTKRGMFLPLESMAPCWQRQGKACSESRDVARRVEVVEMERVLRVFREDGEGSSRGELRGSPLEKAAGGKRQGLHYFFLRRPPPFLPFLLSAARFFRCAFWCRCF